MVGIACNIDKKSLFRQINYQVMNFFHLGTGQIQDVEVSVLGLPDCILRQAMRPDYKTTVIRYVRQAARSYHSGIPEMLDNLAVVYDFTQAKDLLPFLKIFLNLLNGPFHSGAEACCVCNNDFHDC